MGGMMGGMMGGGQTPTKKSEAQDVAFPKGAGFFVGGGDRDRVSAMGDCLDTCWLQTFLGWGLPAAHHSTHHSPHALHLRLRRPLPAQRPFGGFLEEGQQVRTNAASFDAFEWACHCPGPCAADPVSHPSSARSSQIIPGQFERIGITVETRQGPGLPDPKGLARLGPVMFGRVERVARRTSSEILLARDDVALLARAEERDATVTSTTIGEFAHRRSPLFPERKVFEECGR